MNTREAWMRAALTQARLALDMGEVPVGAALVRGDALICADHNRRETQSDPTAHAEMLVLREGARLLGTRRLTDCTLYVTLEPCPMCSGAMVMAMLGGCYYGACDPLQGCCESVYALPMDAAFSHRLPCVGGLMEKECQALLDEFFKARR